jgi:hypothetical protein
MDTVIYRERLLQPSDPRLGRLVNHDSRSRLYPFDTSGLTLMNTRHLRKIPVFDQGNLGSCTGNAGIGCLGTGPFFATHGNHYSLDENGATTLYGDATRADSYDGEYPPTDTGCDGLTIAKVLTAAGEISGYQHTFSLNDALKALTLTPFITGVSWFQDMFTPAPDGQVRPSGTLAGGHEFVADQLDVDNQRIWFTNSWGSNWGVSGRFYMSWDDYGILLGQQGDVTIFVPITVEPPQPVPVPRDPADVALAAAVKDWSRSRHVGANAAAARAVRTWLIAKNL